MTAQVNRRTFLSGVSAAAAVAAVGISGRAAVHAGPAGAVPAAGHHAHTALDRSAFRYAHGDPGYRQPSGRTRRKSASAMSRHEIDRFKRAFTWACHADTWTCSATSISTTCDTASTALTCWPSRHPR